MEVTAGRLAVDTRRSNLSTTYGSEYVDNIPRLRDDVMDFIKMAPGISATRPTQFGNASVSALGSGTNENLFFVDGAEQTSVGSGTGAPPLSTDAIQEVQVITAGASAEYGNYQGAVFNIVTRQGGNDWRFAASYFNQKDTLTAGSTISESSGCEAGIILAHPSAEEDDKSPLSHLFACQEPRLTSCCVVANVFALALFMERRSEERCIRSTGGEG